MLHFEKLFKNKDFDRVKLFIYIAKEIDDKNRLKKMLKVVLLVLLITIVASGLWAGGAEESETAAPEEKLVMAMVTNQSGLGDQSFNDAAWEGLSQAEEKYGIEKKVLESREQAQYVPNLSTLAEQGASLVVGVGFIECFHKIARCFVNN